MRLKLRNWFGSTARLTAAATVVGGATLMAASVGWTQSVDATAGAVTVMFAPWTPFEDAVARVDRAGGVVVGADPGWGRAVAIGAPGASFQARLRDEGAWSIAPAAVD